MYICIGVAIRTNSLGDYSSGYGQIAYVGPQAICPGIFLAGLIRKNQLQSSDIRCIQQQERSKKGRSTDDIISHIS